MCSEKHDLYCPGELVDSWASYSVVGTYHCYNIRFSPSFDYDVHPRSIIFVVKSNLGPELSEFLLDMETDRGHMTIELHYMGTTHLSHEQVFMAREFQAAILSLTVYHNYDDLKISLDNLCQDKLNLQTAYLLLPSIDIYQQFPIIDWDCVKSMVSSKEKESDCYIPDIVHNHRCSPEKCCCLQLKDSKVQSCMIQSVVYTPHNDQVYCITGIFDKLDGHSKLGLKAGETLTYSKFYQSRYGITLSLPQQHLLAGRHLFTAKNYLFSRQCHKQKESSAIVELPPELCVMILSPVDAGTLYSFSFIPSIMYRIESVLLASYLKISSGTCANNNVLLVNKVKSVTFLFDLSRITCISIPWSLQLLVQEQQSSYYGKLEHVRDLMTCIILFLLSDCSIKNLDGNFSSQMKLLEAITTKKCRETFSLESLETLGDSCLKYLASLHLFTNYQNHDEGFLSKKKEQFVSNPSLYQLGCSKKLPGFIRNKEFNPIQWITTFLSHSFLGDDATSHSSSKLSYNMGISYMKNDIVADVVEALIGAYLTTKGETGALAVLQWLGLDINIHTAVSNERVLTSSADTYVNVEALESLLNYSFRNPSLLVEALTHGSYQDPDLRRCYQRLEFLGDAVLDYLITVHMYNTYPEASPELLTNLRSASVNNNCYAHAAVKAGLNKHILHASPDPSRQMEVYSNKFSRSFSSSSHSHGWEAGVGLPKVLADVIESLAGAILVDCGYNKEIVWQSLKPLLEPLVTPETMECHPVKELEELCSRKGYRKNYKNTSHEGMASITIEIEMNGKTISETRMANNKKMAKELASKAILQTMKLS